MVAIICSSILASSLFMFLNYNLNSLRANWKVLSSKFMFSFHLFIWMRRHPNEKSWNFWMNFFSSKYCCLYFYFIHEVLFIHNFSFDIKVIPIPRWISMKYHSWISNGWTFVDEYGPNSMDEKLNFRGIKFIHEVTVGGMDIPWLGTLVAVITFNTKLLQTPWTKILPNFNLKNMISTNTKGFSRKEMARIC